MVTARRGEEPHLDGVKLSRSTLTSLMYHLPFWGVHVLAIVGAIVIGWSWQAFAWLAGSYLVRMFAVTGGYHRYFAHRTYKTSRAFQFILALLAMSSAQQGVLWWSSHHRRHHQHSDEPADIHSPVQRGFWYSHVGWILDTRHHNPDYSNVKDLAKYPELRFLDRHDLAIIVGWGVLLFAIGGVQALWWGHFISLVVTWHATFTINSLSHVWGARRYATSDDSRNNAVLAVLTLGEGWHNNHHHYQSSARQGVRWYQVDITFYGLKLLELLRIVRDVRGVPDHIRDAEVAPVPVASEIPLTVAI